MTIFQNNISKKTMIQIKKESLKKEVIELLKGREAYKGVDFYSEETVYFSNVFENILIDLFGKEKDSNYPNRFSIRQLKDLKHLANKYDYVQLTII